MKKFCLILLSLFVAWGALFSITYAQYDNTKHPQKEDTSAREFGNNPAKLLDKVYSEANDDPSEKVQKTTLDNVNSKYCDELFLEGRFTLARTLCSIKYSIRGYLQYITYIWLAAATIFIIRNWFKIVTATDKEGQMKKFKQNMINLIIWVVLLTSFYFILEAFVSIVNFVAGD